MINWPCLSVLFSGWLYIDAAYRGPQWQCWLFRPVTLLLLVFGAWSADFTDTANYFIVVSKLFTLYHQFCYVDEFHFLLAMTDYPTNP